MIKAFIFDMDGVISDTQTLHLEVDKIVMRRYGIIMICSVNYRRYTGFQGI